MARPDHRELRNRRRREGSRENLLTRSTNFEHADWTETLCALSTANAIKPPDGLADSDVSPYDTEVFLDTGAGSLHVVLQAPTISKLNTDHCFSVYIRNIQASPADTDWVCLIMRSLEGTVVGRVYYDLTNKVVGTETSGVGEIKPLGGLWSRIGVIANMGSAGTSQLCEIYSAEGNGDIVHDPFNANLYYLIGAQCSPDDHMIDFVETTDAIIVP